MIEFLMCQMKNHMDIKTYESMLLRWGESSSNTEKMQEWVETVQSIIGKGVYEGIKKHFRYIEDKKKERDGGMHCVHSFDKASVVHFKVDIGAELTTETCLDRFKAGFSNILGDIVETPMDTTIC